MSSSHDSIAIMPQDSGQTKQERAPRTVPKTSQKELSSCTSCQRVGSASSSFPSGDVAQLTEPKSGCQGLQTDCHLESRRLSGCLHHPSTTVSSFLQQDGGFLTLPSPRKSAHQACTPTACRVALLQSDSCGPCVCMWQGCKARLAQRAQEQIAGATGKKVVGRRKGYLLARGLAHGIGTIGPAGMARQWNAIVALIQQDEVNLGAWIALVKEPVLVDPLAAPPTRAVHGLAYCV